MQGLELRVFRIQNAGSLVSAGFNGQVGFKSSERSDVCNDGFALV